MSEMACFMQKVILNFNFHQIDPILIEFKIANFTKTLDLVPKSQWLILFPLTMRHAYYLIYTGHTQSLINAHNWAASRKKVPNGLNRCHTKRRMGTDFSKKKKKKKNAT